VDIREETEENLPDTRQLNKSRDSALNASRSYEDKSIAQTRKSGDSSIVKDLLACDSHHTYDRLGLRKITIEDYQIVDMQERGMQWQPS